MNKGKLFVISGPSAVGKGTIVRRIIENRKDEFFLSVSATTRDPREGEKNGVHYHFISTEKFDDMAANDGFIEYECVHGSYYGTPKAPVMENLNAGIDVILEIDVKGAMKVRKYMEESTLIFILPPSLDTLRQRILERDTESPEQVADRLGKAVEEISYLERYDYSVINDDLDKAVEDVMSVIVAERLKVGAEAAEVIEKYRREEQ